MNAIPFNKPFMAGNELAYVADAVASGKISGDGVYTRKCHAFFAQRYGFANPLLTTSCTDALEMSAMLLGIAPGDEVIVPSFTFVSTANAFALRGAKIVFADSRAEEPNIDAGLIESLVTPRTRAIVIVHYAGVACDMDAILDVGRRHDVAVVEDAAQAIDSTYRGRPLGTLGRLGTFSFHETKNVICGEGGMLVVNDASLAARAEIIREKGTNRSAFFRGEVDKYGWVDVGSSFLPSDILAAYLFAQLEHLDRIQARRKAIWARYRANLAPLARHAGLALPVVPEYASNNAHMFYLVCPTLACRSALIAHLKAAGVHAVFHYQSLHKSPFYRDRHDARPLENADRFSDCLVRLPFFFEMTDTQVDFISEAIAEFFRHHLPA
jgi:dTDP-4-amino-4,6-dideoxygalactose transaminase